jgi:hypothetical protein
MFIPDPGVKKALDPESGSATLIRNQEAILIRTTGSGSGTLIIITTNICVQLAPRVSTGEDQRYITTPTTLSKNMITNASFRYVFR